MSIIFRNRRFYSIRSITEQKPGFWQVERRNAVYVVFGGKKAGAGRNEWFIEGPDFNATASSMMDALNLLENM